MPNLSYWERRQIEDAYEVYLSAEVVANQISELYRKASRYFSSQAKGIFDKFRRKHGLSEAEARRLIARLDDPTSLAKLQQLLKNIQQTDQIKALRQEIEAAAFRYRLERLQQMQNGLDRVMRQVYRQEKKISTDFYIDVANEAYYKGIFRIQQRAEAAFSFNHISQKVIDRIVNSRWAGSNYSSRIWKNTQDLAQTLKEEILVSLVTGRTVRDTAEIIANRFAQGSHNARRLVRTESNHVHTQLNFEAYKEAGIEKYMYLATLDLRTSKICRSLDGRIFLVKDQKIGVNCPPMHPWCRSTTISVIDEELLKNMQRSAIDPATGKRIKVPATMKYQEWYDKYVVGHDDEISSRQIPDRNMDRQQFERYREHDIGPETYEEFRNMKYSDLEKYGKLKLEYKDKTLQERIRQSYNLTVNPEKQARHIKESDGYITGRSYITVSEEAIQNIVNEYAGKGEIQRYRSGKFAHKELIVLPYDVGINIDPETKVETPTNRLFIHYSNTGVHLVPTLREANNA